MKAISRLKRGISAVLSAALIAPLIAFPAEAETTDVYIPEIEMEEGILENDVFYLTASSAQLKEGANERYLLRLARGGDCASASDVTVKISDLTAKYGRDYRVSLLGGDTEAVSPDDNLSFLERIEGEEYTEAKLESEEEFNKMLENDEELKEQTQTGLQDVVDYMEEESGLLSADEQQNAETEAVPSDSGTSSLQQARAMFTGIEGEPQNVTATTDMMQQIQQMANVITNVVVGATLNVEFAEGEKEKYIAIDVEDNGEGDGDRTFFMVLADPHGTTTISASSTCALTVVDDEEQQPSRIYFAEESYNAEGDSVTVEIKREGALNTISEAHLTSENGTAEAGRDFSPVEMDVIFPMGIDTRKIDIPIRGEYILGSADFKLKLEESEVCSIDGGEATVTIDGTLGETVKGSDGSDATLSSVTTAYNLQSIVTGSELDLSKAEHVQQDSHYNGTNGYDSNNKYWDMMWKDDSNGWDRAFSWLPGVDGAHNGNLYASWKLTDTTYNGYDIAGAQIKWKTTGSCPRVKIGFVTAPIVNNPELLWSWYSGTSWDYNAQATIADNTVTNIFCQNNDPAYLAVQYESNCRDCNHVYISSIKPIYRPFQIMLTDLETEDQPQFLGEDNKYHAWSDAAFLALLGADNTSNNEIIRYTKDEANQIGYSQSVGGNTTSPYVYLSGMSIVNEDGSSPKQIASYEYDGLLEHSFTLTSKFIYDNKSYIKFLKNDIDGWGNQTTQTNASRGTIYLKPSFGYITSNVTVKAPEQKMGNIVINGDTNGKISNASDVTKEYHYGDILKISTVMDPDYAKYYEPAGFELKYKANKNSTKWDREEIISYTEDNGTSAYLDANKRLKKDCYEITPLFKSKQGAMTVRVRKDELANFDTSYSFMKAAAHNTMTDKGVTYEEYVISDDPIYGKVYPLSVRMSDTADANIYPLWTEANNNRFYSGEVFLHKALPSTGSDTNNNIITLSVEKGTAENVYQSVTGSVFSPFYNLQTRTATDVNSRPARNAIVNFAGNVTYVNDDGSFTVPPFRAISSTSSSDRYVRYMISLNGQELFDEIKLVDNGTEDREITVIDGEQQVTKKVPVCDQTAGLIRMTSETGSILENISLSSAGNSGSTIKLKSGDDSTVEITATVNGTMPYKKTYVKDNTLVSEDAEEKVTGIEFVVYDRTTFEEIDSCKAEPVEGSDDQFTADMPLSKINHDDLLYIRVTTDRSHGVTGDRTGFDDSNPPDEETVKAMDTTTYTDTFTGFTFIEDTEMEIPVLQYIDLPLSIDFFEELPLLGDTGTRFDLPFVSFGCIKTSTGYRMYIGFSPVQLVDTIKHTHLNKYEGDNHKYWQDEFEIAHPIETFLNGLGQSFETAFGQIPHDEALMEKFGGKLSLGAPTWKMDIQIGIYCDFTYARLLDTSGKTKGKNAVFTGIGLYLGLSAGFRMTCYWFLPVVFIPAYFGVEISGNVLGFIGAGTDLSKSQITYTDAQKSRVDFNNVLGEFEASVQMGATVQIYVGVGLAGTIGLRGGGTFSAMALYEPDPYVDDWGCDLVLKLGIWVDLFLFSIPLQYSFPDWKFGSFEQYAQMGPVTPTSLSDNNDISLTSAENEPTFSVRQPYSDEKSEWRPDGDISLMSAFGEASSETIVDNAYEHPDTQLIKLSDDSVFAAFLDSDTSRGATERTVLKYAVYKGGTWSDPKVVQDDKKADFQPSVCEIEDGKVMIAWLSSDPDKATTEDSADYLRNLEVYTAVIDPANGTVSGETRLTTDEYYDYNPTCVYDEKTHDRAVYYVKTGNSEGTAADLANSYTNDCAVIYMLYSAEKSKWMVDEYYPEELSDSNGNGSTEDEKETLINEWHGQRFLSSPLPELGLDVPNVSDFTAITYNGIAVYAYTIDQDSNGDTTNDKELFVQCYDFEKHTTYKPVRITDDNVADALPQFVRTENKAFAEAIAEHPEAKTTKAEAADTKLFWYRDDRTVAYIDITSLVRDGIDNDGHIKDEYLNTENSNEVKDIDSLYSYVAMPAENSDNTRYMADFKAVTDGDDIYVVWTQPETKDKDTDDFNEKQGTEIYATALIQNDPIPSSDPNEPAEAIGSAWAPAYRLTNTGAFTDEPNAVIDDSGNLMVMYNSFKQKITDNAENPVEISDFKLMASYMTPCGAVDVTDITLSDETPGGGDTADVYVDITNNGLTYADGYTLNVYEAKNGKKHGEPIYTLNSDSKLLPSGTDTLRFEWTAPASVEGVSLIAEVKEGGMENVSSYESDRLEDKPQYVVDDVYPYQDSNGYHVKYNITNTGNVPSNSDDTMNVIFSGPYGAATGYTVDECDWGKAAMDGIGVGETKSFTIDINAVAEPFEKYGFVDCLLLGKNKDGEYVTQGENISLTAAMPMEFMLNGEPFPEKIELAEGETMDFSITCEPSALSEGMSAALGTDDAAVAAFDGTTLKAIGEGTTVIHGNVTPYGNAIPDITVTVTPRKAEPTSRPHGSGSGASRRAEATPAPTASPEPTATPEPTTEPDGGNTAETQFNDVTSADWFSGSVKYATEKGYFAGVSEDTFEPNTNITRGMLITVIGRMNGVKPESTDMTYTDVNKDMYYAPYIAWGTENGIVSGYSDTEFAPDELVTREQVAAMLWRYAQYIGKDVSVGESTNILSYADAEETSEYAIPAIQWACGSGVMSGYTDNTLRPQNNATRAEAAALTERFDKTIK